MVPAPVLTGMPGIRGHAVSGWVAAAALPGQIRRLALGWVAGGWVAGGWVAGGWVAGGWVAGGEHAGHGRCDDELAPHPVLGVDLPCLGDFRRRDPEYVHCVDGA